MLRAILPSRRIVAGCSILLVMLCSFPASGEGTKSAKKPDLKRQVEHLEEIWRIAQLNDDIAEMDKLLSEDYVGITMNGQVVTKMQQLDRMRTRQFVLTKIELNDVKVKLIGTTAVVTSQAEVEGTNEGNSIRGTYRYTRVYSRLPSGAWKITNFEATRVGPRHQNRDADRAQNPAPKTE
jgi:ketosteroid isomerase-like protein